MTAFERPARFERAKKLQERRLVAHAQPADEHARLPIGEPLALGERVLRWIARRFALKAEPGEVDPSTLVEHDAIAVADRLRGFGFAYPLGAAAVRRHHRESFREPLRRTRRAKRPPARKMHMRQFMRENAFEAIALLAAERRRQKRRAGARHGGDAGIIHAVGARVILIGCVDADDRRLRKGASVRGLDLRDGAREASPPRLAAQARASGS